MFKLYIDIFLFKHQRLTLIDATKAPQHKQYVLKFSFSSTTGCHRPVQSKRLSNKEKKLSLKDWAYETETAILRLGV